MIKKIITAIVLMISFTVCKAQTGSGWEWASATNVAYALRGVTAVTTDAAGNVYATGLFYNNMTLEGITITDATFYYHSFIAKYTSTGSIVWLKNCTGGSGVLQQASTTINVDNAGNIFIGGGQYTTTSATTIGNGYVEKYDNAGNFIWNTQLALYKVVSVNIDAAGNPIAMETLPGFFNVYKIDKTTGSLLWTTQNTGTAIPVASSTIGNNFLDSKGNIYYSLYGFLGNANGIETIGNQTFTNPGNTACMVSLNKDGEVRWIDSLRNYPAFPTGVLSYVGNTDKIYFIFGNLSASAVSSGYGGLSGTNQSLTSAAAYFELDTLGKVTKSLFNPPAGFGTGSNYFKNGSMYSFITLQGLANSTYTQSFGDYTFQSPAAANKNLNIIVKYDPATYSVVWANTFETTGTDASSTYVGGASTIDVTNTGKVVLGGNYGTTAVFGSITKTAVNDPANSNPNIKADLFISQFNETNVAAPSMTTWTGAANNMNYSDPLNWDNGVPNYNKTVIPAGIATYPNNILATAKIGKLIINTGASVTLPLLVSVPGGITNNGIINVTEAGIFFSGFNSGQTVISGTGKVVLLNNATYLFAGSNPMNNSLEINCTGTLTSFGANINGSLFLTNGIVSGNVTLTNPAAAITSSASSYIMGTVTRTVNTSGSYTFPVGSSNRYAPVFLQLNNIIGPQKISVSFSNTINGSLPNVTIGAQTVTQLLNGGIFTVTPDAVVTAGNYSIKLQETGYTNGVANPAQYVVLKRANSSSTWGFYGNNAAATQIANTATASANNITGFSDFAIGIANAAVLLPLQLNYFLASLKNEQVTTVWQTSNEINIRHFEIERSFDGINFTKAGMAEPQNTVGNHSYEYIDLKINSLLQDVIYYRLKIVDNDGKFTYSQIQKVKLNNQTHINCYPNPTTGIINIDGYNTITRLQLFNMEGKKIKEWSSNFSKIDISEIFGGAYILSVQLKTGDVSFQKIIKK